MTRILATPAGTVEKTGAPVRQPRVSFLSLFGAAASVLGSLATSSGAAPAPAPAPGWAIPAEERDVAVLALKRQWSRNVSAAAPAMELGTLLLLSGRREEALRTLILTHSSTSSPASRSHLESRVRVLSRSFITADGARAYQAGVNALLAGDFLPALARFHAVMVSEDQVLDAVVRKGQVEALLGRLDSATETFRLARQLNPFDAEVRAWLGFALLARGERDEGGREMRSAWTMASPGQRARAHWRAWMARAQQPAPRSAAAKSGGPISPVTGDQSLVESSGWSLWAMNEVTVARTGAARRFLNLFPNGYRRLVGASGLDLEWWEPGLLTRADDELGEPEEISRSVR